MSSLVPRAEEGAAPPASSSSSSSSSSSRPPPPPLPPAELATRLLAEGVRLREQGDIAAARSCYARGLSLNARDAALWAVRERVCGATHEHEEPIASSRLRGETHMSCISRPRGLFGLYITAQR
jgi:hypothetical protein